VPGCPSCRVKCRVKASTILMFAQRISLVQPVNCHYQFGDFFVLNRTTFMSSIAASSEWHVHVDNINYGCFV